MRSVIRATFGALAFAAVPTLSAAAQSAPTKIAYINSQAILQQAPGRAEAEAKFDHEMSTYRAQVQSLNDSLNKMIDEYKKAEPTLSPTAKDTRSKAIVARQQEYQKRVQELQGKAGQRENELMGPIMDQIRKVIETVRAEDGYAVVFDVAPNANSGIAAVDKNLEITDRVISRLKAAGPVAAGAPAAGKPAPGKPATGPVVAPAGVGRPIKPPAQR